MIKCNHLNDDCFRASGSRCALLVQPIDKSECPFYKTYEQNKEDCMKAHQRLIDIGRIDLVQKYEYNPKREW